MLHDLTDFLSDNESIDSTVSYYYQARNFKTGQLLQLPRTKLAEKIAHGLMRNLASNNEVEGKMYGVLLVETHYGEQKVLKAVSGLAPTSTDWVPSIPGRAQVAEAERSSLKALEQIKQKLKDFQSLPQKKEYLKLSQYYQEQIEALNFTHAQNRQLRNKTRALTPNQQALEQLEQDSRAETRAKKQLKQQRDSVLRPLEAMINQADEQIKQLKQKRKFISSNLQNQLYQAYRLNNFQGESLSLDSWMPIPTGTGECCLPKLLHYAAVNRLKPLSLAEFWWGSSLGGKVSGQFYGACLERCQPLLGFLLSGISNIDLPIVYEDPYLLVVDKPNGLLSVPGRYSTSQDSVENRLKLYYGEGQFVKAVHRLDQDTSGVIVIAKDPVTYQILLKQFASREITKIYEAVLDGVTAIERGTIGLPLWSDPLNRPYQKVDWELGKPSITHFQLIACDGLRSRLELIPETGRTHQLRMHVIAGLGAPILGDRLYGSQNQKGRLYLHAKKICFQHPQLADKYLHLQSDVPF